MPGLCTTTSITETNLFSRVNCYPNPTNDYLIIDYSLPSTMNVSVRLYNYLGSEVLSTPQATKNTGQNSLKLETRTLSPGVYIVKLEIGTAIISKKIIIL